MVMKIDLTNLNVFGATYRPRQDLYTNIYSVETFVERKHFLYKDTLYKQIDGITMSCALRPTLARFFIAHMDIQL